MHCKRKCHLYNKSLSGTTLTRFICYCFKYTTNMSFKFFEYHHLFSRNGNLFFDKSHSLINVSLYFICLLLKGSMVCITWIWCYCIQVFGLFRNQFSVGYNIVQVTLLQLREACTWSLVYLTETASSMPYWLT